MEDTEDTIVISANQEKNNVKDMLFKQNCCYAVGISKDRWNDIKYIGVYEGYPKSAITYIAEVKEIELLDLKRLEGRVGVIKPEVIKSIEKHNEEGEKCVIYFSEKGLEPLIPPIKKGEKVIRVRGRRYTNYEKLRRIQQQKEPTLDDLFPEKS